MNGTETVEIIPVNLRKVERYETNPLIEPKAVRSKRKTVGAIRKGPHGDFSSGEIYGDTAILIKRELDDAAFVKVFEEGIKAAFDLTGPGSKVWQCVLNAVNTGGAKRDQVILHPDLVTGPKATYRMSDKTYWRGLRELMAKQFIARTLVPHVYWINPHYCFKGNRLTVISEYNRARRDEASENEPLPLQFDDEAQPSSIGTTENE